MDEPGLQKTNDEWTKFLAEKRAKMGDLAKSSASPRFKRSRLPPAEEGSDEYFEQIEAAMRAKPESTAGNKVTSTLLTLVGFVVASRLTFSWKSLLELVAVLSFHEAGHMIAMKRYGYTNLRAYFIPFLGAMVTGSVKERNSEQQAVISLMGPLPGILLGAAFAIYQSATHDSSVSSLAIMFVGLNAANLLPLRPFDGGHFVADLWLTRNRYVEVVVNVLTGAVLILFGAIGGGSIFYFLGTIVLLGAKPILKQTKIATELKAKQTTAGIKSDEVPRELLVETVRLARLEYSYKFTPTALGRLSKAVWVRVLYSPPRKSVAIGLTSLYLFTILVAFVSLGVLFGLNHASPGQISPAN